MSRIAKTNRELLVHYSEWDVIPNLEVQLRMPGSPQSQHEAHVALHLTGWNILNNAVKLQ